MPEQTRRGQALLFRGQRRHQPPHLRATESLGLGIGIEAGYATLGRIGFEGRDDYGAIGPVTNLASRLSTRAAGGQILIGPRLFAAVEGTVQTEPVGELDLHGFGRAVVAYEVRGLRTATASGSP